jgi:hypothetical protein
MKRAFFYAGDGEDSVFGIGLNERLFDYLPDRFYRGYKIAYDPPPIPIRSFDYHYAHVHYDGEGDPRCGATCSVDQAKREIDDLIEGED